MLKSKESYSSEKAYIRAFFLHNSYTTDYPIDPIVGSFIRVIHPCEDQPTGDGKGYYTRPQVLFFGNGNLSRFYELTDMIKIKGDLEFMIDAISNSKSPKEVNLGINSVFHVKHGNIFFKAHGSETNTYFASNPLSRPPSYVKAMFDNLLDSMDRIINGVPPKDSVLELDDMIMATLKYQVDGVRSAIIMTARKFESRELNFIMLRRSNQLMTIPHSSKVSAREYIVPFLDLIEEIGEALLAKPDLERIVRFVGEQDDNMEYINSRYADLGSGPKVFTTLNSDRYPANTKINLGYDPIFHKQLKEKVVEFCNRFSTL
ncbi:hypothetical protein AH04_274 [Erwinia phage AH04]|uniref:Uncharacterized protein n=1 Tax=Erwinia phage AH04 TaxID=2869569 RepID=A0AAE7X0V7_9CAUD|nr:hypothetical protein PQC02_gp040 [Erwinia phage AH04]QZA70747.1 hypothetical protein AH04_274 [Erwinia phage AH04]